MPGITIQSGFSLANPPAIRGVSSAADDHFSNALLQKTKTPAKNNVADHTPESDAKTDSEEVGKAGQAANGTADRTSQVKGTGDQQDTTDDDAAEKKDKGDEESDALSPQITAERVLAQHWPTSTAKGGAPADNGAGGGTGQVAAARPTGQSADIPVSTGDAALTGESAAPAASDPTNVPTTIRKAGSQPNGPTIQLVTASTEPKSAPDGKGDAPAPIPADNQAVVDPGMKGVSVSAASSAEPANANATFLARIAAMHHDRGSPVIAQGAGGAASGATPTPANGASSQVSPISSSRGSGNADTNPDGQNDGGEKASNGAQQNLPLSSIAAAGDTSSAPLPTAQMAPASSSAASFAGALAHDGRLAHYVDGATAARATGTPENALPVQSLRIQLRPVELGAVTANLKYAGSQLTIDIEVETSDAQRRLSNDSSDIVKSLQSLGLQVDKITVRQIQGPAQAQAQGQGQPTARDGSAGSFAGQGNTPFSMSGQSGRQTGGQQQGTEKRHEDGSEHGIGAVRRAADSLPRRGVFI